jgi:hypothetical protein
MPNEIVTIIFTVIAVYLFLVVTLPEYFFPFKAKKSKKVGSTYWGFYEGANSKESEETKKIEIMKPARKHKSIAGSTMYTQGRGTSFRQ